MLTTKIECKFSELPDNVLPLLRGRVFHLAEVSALALFQKRGMVPAAHVGQFASALCPAQTSYGGRRGYICLFDFRNAGGSDLEQSFVRHYFLRPFHYGHAYSYLLLSPSAWPRLISWKRASAEVGARELYIPFVEAWYPGDLPLELVTDCLIVSVQPTARTVREILAKAAG